METSVIKSKTQALFVSESIKPLRLSSNFEAALQEVKPLFKNWLEADSTFTKNTKTVAKAVRAAWQLYQKQEGHQGRIGFARLFDPSIPEGKTARELWENKTFNRMNYLIDKVGRVVPEGEAAERVPVKEKRVKMRRLINRFDKKHAKGTIKLEDVHELIKSLLAQIWPEEGVQEVIERATA